MDRTSEQGTTDSALRLVQLAVLAARTDGRPDLVALLQRAIERASRPDTVVAVLGEFKQGKSSLINGLLGEDASPVDDDLATATIILFRHGPERQATARFRDGEGAPKLLSEAEFAEVATERGNPGNRLGVELVEAELPNELLAQGLTLVDTPGFGGVSGGYGGLTLGFLPAVHGVIFVTDASSPITAAEADFLRRAREICPFVVLVLTKKDLHPEWQRIAAIDGELASGAGIAVPPLAVSAVLRAEAFARGDRELNEESGFPALINAIHNELLVKAREAAAGRALEDARRVVRQLRIAAETELRPLQSADPGQEFAALQEARQRLDQLRAGGARWSTVLNDGFADLAAEVDYRFRSAIRQITRDADERIESESPDRAWETLGEELRERVSEVAQQVVVELEEGAEEIRRRIAELLAEDETGLADTLSGSSQVEVRQLWVDKPLSKPSPLAPAATVWGGLRGAQSGILVFGMMANIVGIALTTAATLGVGAVFAAKQVFEDRQRQATQKRQAARTAARQFLDDAQFEIAKAMRDLARDLQRQLRDHFSERIEELSRTLRGAAEALQRSLQESTARREERIGTLRKRIEQLDRLLGEIEAAAGAQP